MRVGHVAGVGSLCIWRRLRGTVKPGLCKSRPSSWITKNCIRILDSRHGQRLISRKQLFISSIREHQAWGDSGLPSTVF